MENTRRVKLLMINPADFMSLFTKGLKVRGGWKLIQGIPKDAKLVGMTAEPVRGGVILIIESAEYEPIPLDTKPPVQMIEINLTGRHVKQPKKT